MFKKWLNEQVEDLIVKAAKDQIKEFPDPDYGRLFWHPEQKKVHFVVGDGAGGYKVAKQRFSLIPGVEKVEIADEYFPSKKESGWVKLEFK